MSTEIILLIVGLVLTVGTGLFVASEFALVNLDRPDLEARQETRRARPRCDHPGAQGHVDPPVERPARHHADDAARRVHSRAGDLVVPPPAARRRSACPTGAVSPVATVIAVAIATILSMIFGELVPQNLALAIPLRTGAHRDSVPDRVHDRVPAIRGGAQRRGQRDPARDRHRAARRDLAPPARPMSCVSLVRRSAREGALDQDTATLLARTLVFSEHTRVRRDDASPEDLEGRPLRQRRMRSSLSPGRPGTRAFPCSTKTSTTSRASCTSSRPSPCRATAAPRCRCRRCSPRRCGCPRR